MRTNLFLALLPFASLALAACGGGSGSSFSAADIIDQSPTGLMEGAPWTMVSAVVVDEGDDLSVSLYPEEVEACDAFASSDSMILFRVPAMEGEYPLSFDLASINTSRTITFVTGPGQNVIASNGLIVVESLGDNVTVGLLAEAGDNQINGRFTSPICAD